MSKFKYYNQQFFSNHNHNKMQSQKVKLVKSQNGGQQFFVFLDRQVGKGGFGTVYEAVSCSDKTRKLVVKIMHIQNENRRKTIETQLKILSQLPTHENIVKIIPTKIYSDSNYYLFMEYCQDGTLYDLIDRRKGNPLTEEEIYSVIYQCLNGYKILFDKKILHQDIKPQNILIRNGFYKLADFGLSIFYEGYNFSSTREGTLRYIAPEKMTIKDYVGNPKSDIYSFGVMFFELITRHHPYIKPYEKGISVKEFLRELKDAKLRIPNNLYNSFSLKFTDFFDRILLKMLKKSQKNRISFQQIWQYVQNKQMFANARQKQRQLTKQHLITEYNYVVSEITSVFSIPLSQQSNKQYILSNIKKQIQQQQLQQMTKLGQNVADYFLKKRLLVYLFDRLARKLIVQQLKLQSKIESFDKCILELILLTKSLLDGIISEIKNPKVLTPEHFLAFKRTHPLSSSILTILRKDHQYVQDSLCDLLSQPNKLSKQQTKLILQLNKQNNSSQIINELKKSLINLLTPLVQCIDLSDKSRLITLVNIMNVINLLNNYQNVGDDIQKIEENEKNVLMSSVTELTIVIRDNCEQLKIPYGFDVTQALDEDSEEERITFEQ